MGAVSVDNPPVPGESFTDEYGNITKPWRTFFYTLWQRTGGANDFISGSSPTASMQPLASTIIPDGWLLCDGDAISRTDFSELFSEIGITYGPGNGTTTFNIPDCRGRTLIGAGQGSGLTDRSLASTGGLEEVELTVAEMPAHAHPSSQDPHTHTVTDPGHGHSLTDPGHSHGNSTASFVNTAAGTEYDNTNGDKGTTNVNTASSTTGISIGDNITGITNDATSITIEILNTGGSGTHENMQPFLAVNYIIRTGL